MSERQWATIDQSTGPDNIWKGRIFTADNEDEARQSAHAFGYTVLTRETTNDEWEPADDWAGFHRR